LTTASPKTAAERLARALGALPVAALLGCASPPGVVAEEPGPLPEETPAASGGSAGETAERDTESPAAGPVQARVQLTEVDDDIFKFIVFNLTREPMVILRDEIVAVTPTGTLRREPGGVSSVYNVPPGGAHDVNVKFDLDGVNAGDRIEVRFDRAVLINGAPTRVAPVVFRATGS
jgi:hypothetical protein